MPYSKQIELFGNNWDFWGIFIEIKHTLLSIFRNRGRTSVKKASSKKPLVGIEINIINYSHNFSSFFLFTKMNIK